MKSFNYQIFAESYKKVFNEEFSPDIVSSVGVVSKDGEKDMSSFYLATSTHRMVIKDNIIVGVYSFPLQRDSQVITHFDINDSKFVCAFITINGKAKYGCYASIINPETGKIVEQVYSPFGESFFFPEDKGEHVFVNENGLIDRVETIKELGAYNVYKAPNIETPDHEIVYFDKKTVMSTMFFENK